MTNSFRIFLLVVEEMSISKAAKKAFVTQQCVSDHIRRLEETYGIELFERRPRLALTPAGETMLRTLQQIQILETAMESSLKEVSSGVKGHLSLGLNSTRARVLLPKILGQYREMFPQVTMSFVLDDTENLQEMLLKGKLDLFIGVNVAENPLFQVRRLSEDAVFLLVGDKLLSRHIAGELAEIKKEFAAGVPLERFEEVPFTQNLQLSTITSLINRHKDALNVTLDTIYWISDYDVQISLCGMNIAASFCPAMILERVVEHNRTAGEDARINIFPIENLNERLRIDLITHKNVVQPLYLKEFIALTARQFDH